MVNYKELFELCVAGSGKRVQIKVAPKAYFDFLNNLIEHGCDCWCNGEKFVTEPHEIDTNRAWYMFELWYSNKLNKYVLGQVPHIGEQLANSDTDLFLL